MSLPNSYPQAEANYDELDRLVQRALKALMCKQSPPERVWKRIKVELEQEKSPSDRFRISWLPLVLQPALTIWLIVLGAIGLQISSIPHDIRPLSSPSLTPSVAADYLEEDLTSIALAMLQDKAELRLAKTHSKPRLSGSPSCPKAYAAVRPATSAGELGAIEPVRAGIQLPDTGPADQPPIIVPRDFIPNVLSPEGRALMAELSSQRLAVEDRQRKQGGPYRWYR
jgi:hypothetical protein